MTIFDKTSLRRIKRVKTPKRQYFHGHFSTFFLSLSFILVDVLVFPSFTGPLSFLRLLEQSLSLNTVLLNPLSLTSRTLYLMIDAFFAFVPSGFYFKCGESGRLRRSWDSGTEWKVLRARNLWKGVFESTIPVFLLGKVLTLCILARFCFFFNFLF